MKKISIGEIIYRIQEHPLLKSVRKSDIVNHIKTVIELIGVPALKDEHLITLTIANYRAKLPQDFLERKVVRKVNSETDKITLTHNTDEYAQFDRDIYKDTTVNADVLYTHIVKDGYIYTDFKEGIIELVYNAYSVDLNGWPQIPKNESVVLAIENYIKSRYFGILADMDEKYLRAYQRAEQQYNWYLKQATTSLLNLDPVEADALGKKLIRMLPVEEDAQSNYKYGSQSERLNRSLW